MSSEKKLAKNITWSLLFWAISFSVTLNLFSRGNEITTLDWIYTFLFHIPFVAVVFLNIYQAIPNFLERFNVLVYIIAVSIAGFGVVQGLYYLSYGPIAKFLFPDYYFVVVYSPLELFGIMAIYITSSTLVELSKSWFNRKETELEIAQLEEEKTKSELRALQAQINPHFLFNSLNMIYGESMQKTEKAPEMILKLSDILRYVVDNMDKPEVLVRDEIEYIRKFIELQKERLSNPDRVIFKTDGDFKALTISPLLLITFVENAFKHGSVSGLNERIKISISEEQKSLKLRVENPVNDIEILDKPSSTGKGLSNTKQRLEMIYPNRYNLDINKEGSIFTSELEINLS